MLRRLVSRCCPSLSRTCGVIFSLAEPSIGGARGELRLFREHNPLPQLPLKRCDGPKKEFSSHVIVSALQQRNPLYFLIKILNREQIGGSTSSVYANVYVVVRSLLVPRRNPSFLTRQGLLIKNEGNKQP